MNFVLKKIVSLQLRHFECKFCYHVIAGTGSTEGNIL